MAFYTGGVGKMISRTLGHAVALDQIRTEAEARRRLEEALSGLDGASAALAAVGAAIPGDVELDGPEGMMQHLTESAAVALEALRPEIEALRSDLLLTDDQLQRKRVVRFASSPAHFRRLLGNAH